jgi:Niemann-Pick C1 protein
MCLILTVIFGITFLLIGNIRACMITTLGLGMNMVALMGILYFWDIKNVSVVNLSVAIGLTLGFATHISFAFMHTVGTLHERTVGALCTIGPAFFHGGFSTLLAVSVMGLNPGYAHQVILKMFFVIITLGIFHGMIFVPQLLSMIGTNECYLSEADRA